MIETVDINVHTTLEDYEEVAHLAPLLRDMKTEAKVLSEKLRGRTVWMVNSTAQGGGVAEMLPRVVSMMCELGVETCWAVIGADDMAFFDLTKQLHNLIHDSGALQLPEGAKETYEATNRRNADAFAPMLKDGDDLAEPADFALDDGSPAIDAGEVGDGSECANEPHDANGACRIDLGHLGNTATARTNDPDRREK